MNYYDFISFIPVVIAALLAQSANVINKKGVKYRY